MKIVTVFAHQDDEMRCLGTLLRLREVGHLIAMVCVSSGNKGLAFGNADDQARAAAVRAAEMRAVADELGAEYHCLDREDGFVWEDAALRRELIALLRELGAELILTHWATDYNSDHMATANAVVNAALFVNLPSFEPSTPALENVPAIFHVNPGDGYGFEATHFVELDDELAETKARLVRLHVSQMAVMRQLRGRDYADDMDDEDRRQGARLMVDRAESFRPCLSERRIPWQSVLPGPITPKEFA
jgi:LmbE family N-acetylglucosaminyl deacetylase